MTAEPEFRKRFREEDIPAISRNEEPPAMRLAAVAEIRGRILDMHCDGMPSQAIANKVGLSKSWVGRIIRNLPGADPETDQRFHARVWQRVMRRCRRFA